MSYTHLTAEERYQIEDLRREGYSQKKIAIAIGRSESTLSREIRRNRGDRGWRPRQAHQKAQERLTRRGSENVSRISEVVWDYVHKHLQQDQWSPEQIAGRLSLEGVGTVSHETIYQHILDDKKAEARCTNTYDAKRREKSATARQGHHEEPLLTGLTLTNVL